MPVTRAVKAVFVVVAVGVAAAAAAEAADADEAIAWSTAAALSQFSSVLGGSDEDRLRCSRLITTLLPSWPVCAVSFG